MDKYNQPLLFQDNEAFMLGNLFQNLYQSYKGFSNYYFQPLNNRQQLLLALQINDFIAHEINLYLDNHPHDQSMINMYKEYIKRSMIAKDNYEKQYGPLLVNNASNQAPFNWINSPWPWQHQN